MPRPRPANPPEPAAEQGQTPLPDWRVRGRWIRGTACNLLATLIILYGGLWLGSQASWLWKSSGSPTQPTSHVLEVVGGSNAGSPNLPHAIQSGDAPLALRRQAVVMDRAEVERSLLQQVATAAEQAPAPVHSTQPAERRLLARIANLQPSAVRPGHWRAFYQDGPLPLAVAVTDSAGKDSGLPVRVLSWSLAMPTAERQWTLFTCLSSQSAQQRSAMPGVALPPDALPGLSLTAEDGGRLVSFTGAGSLGIWRDHFRRQLAAEGESDPWRESGQHWHARFADSTGRQIDVLLSTDAENGLSGMLVEMPVAGSQRKGQTP